MSIEAKAGEVWFADLGMTAKSRPVLVLAYPQADDARALVVVAPLTSQIRGMRGEVEIGKLPLVAKTFCGECAGIGQFRSALFGEKDGVPWGEPDGAGESGAQGVARDLSVVEMGGWLCPS